MHEFYFVSAHGDDAPGKSQDIYLYCPKCGSVKRDYRHNGGQTSSNFPMYLGIGCTKGWVMREPPCSSN